MKTKLLLITLGLALLPGAQAALTGIAQVPLLNITGTGTVKPNLMLMYDNSGSMAFISTPDYVDDSTTCRSRALASSGTRSCSVGNPPFNSPDFNKQYYNPAVLYLPPVYATGASYPTMNSANTTGWTLVPTDPWGINDRDLLGNAVDNTNMLTGFPDVKWCNTASPAVCEFNTASYAYPDNTFYTPVVFYANPYYYSIGVAEYCTDSSLTNCTTTAVGAAAPPSYPVAAKVRWCNSSSLSTCRAKYSSSYKYPRFGTPNGGQIAQYGTLTVGASSSTSSLTITDVKVVEAGGAVTISNGTVTAATGTNTTGKQTTLAVALAASINAKSGLTNQYIACVKTASGGVSACSSYGISLAADNIVAVIPADCPSGVKVAANCTPLTDSSRAGWAITATASTLQIPPTAIITVSGTTSSSSSPVLSQVTLGSTALMASSLSLGKSKSASTVATSIKNKIGTVGTITAYTGGNSITPTCAAKSSTSVCLVNSAATTNGTTITMGSMTNNVGAGGSSSGGSTVFTLFAGAGASSDVIPVTTVAIAGGGAVFTRTDIIPSRTSYPKVAARTDCTTTAGICTYAEEMNNFSNWYAYYKSRNQMMKTAVGLAFNPLNANYRVGLATLSVAAVDGAMTREPKEFTGVDRTNWYSSLYAMSTSGSTPIRPAMHAIGKMFANQSPYNKAAGEEVVQYPCQQNFMIITTDGYWNGSAAATVVNNDNVASVDRFCSVARGCVDPSTQSANSLADVALYWYNGGSNTGTVSLRPTLEPDMTRPGSVPAAAGDNTHLHVNTYTLGLGVDGVMNYESNYDTSAIVGGDFYKIITGVTTGCPWNANGAYKWPDPNTGDSSGSAAYQERVDDLWHAAINGHGKYFSASAPQEVVNGLSDALNNIQVRVGAAAAAATSTPNISQQDNDIFSDTFTTVKWFGELSDKKIDITTGVVGNTAVWISSDTLGQKVAAATDTRVLKMLDTGSGALKNFLYSEMSAQEKAWFDNKCTLLAQCTTLSVANQAIVNNGANIVDWLRGQQQYADDSILRAYAVTSNTPAGASGPVPIVLGDIVSSKPAFLRDPRKSYALSGYAQYRVDNAARQATVFTAANDGMLHAFNAADGQEMWAYLPRITMSKLHMQASTTYATNHQFTADGSPELGDVEIGGVWKTVLVAGLNGGGRGFYALDVTDPAAPVALWERCADATVCPAKAGDVADTTEMGLSFGNAQYGKWNGQWVVFVTSGYNNVPGVDGVNVGTGGGFLYVINVATGVVVARIATGSGDSTTPSGLARITAISANPFTDPNITYIYGGDNLGQLWRFDLTDTVANVITVSKLADAGALQPITTRPDVTLCRAESTAGDGSVSASAVTTVLFGTGRLLDLPDTATTDVQSLYMVRDQASLVSVRNVSQMVEQTLSRVGAASNTETYTITDHPVDLATKKGWFVDFDLNVGERINLDPKIVGGTASVVTNVPSASSSCSVGGYSNVYHLDVCSGSFIMADQVAGSTLSNTSAAVGFIIVRLPSGALKMITTTADGKTLTTGVTAQNTHGARKIGWRRVK